MPRPDSRFGTLRPVLRILVLAAQTRAMTTGYGLALLGLIACPTHASDPALAVEPISAVPIHLEDQLHRAQIDATIGKPKAASKTDWDFANESECPWNVIGEGIAPCIGDSLQLRVRKRDAVSQSAGGWTGKGKVFVRAVAGDIPALDLDEVGHVELRARYLGKFTSVHLGFNVAGKEHSSHHPFHYIGRGLPLVGDGEVHTYALRTDDLFSSGDLLSHRETPRNIEQIGILAESPQTAAIEILSVRIVPQAKEFMAMPAGTTMVEHGGVSHRSIYVHTPATLTFSVRVPQNGRLSLAMGVLGRRGQAAFRITVRPSDGEEVVVVDESRAGDEPWSHKSVELSRWAGKNVSLMMKAESPRKGSIAFWGSPTLSGEREDTRPNVVLYVMDGVSAYTSSAYGYDRKTTPNLERLARKGALFSHAYSTAAWTSPSTTTFLTSLHNSVLYQGKFSPLAFRGLPSEAVPMAEYFHKAGYQTARLSTNSWVGTISGLERGVDFLRDEGAEPNIDSSEHLLVDFERWRREFPAEPYWAHFQSTDPHWPYDAVDGFSGKFVTPSERATYEKSEAALMAAVGIPGRMPPGKVHARFYRSAKVDVAKFSSTMQGLYDESVAHNDHNLGKLVEYLEETGSWDNTILLVTSDHGHNHSGGAITPEMIFKGRPQKHPLDGKFHVPLVVVAPGRVRAGVQIDTSVSLIDLLPTLLDLAEIAPSPHAQGKSLAPLIANPQPAVARPVVMDELQRSVYAPERSGYVSVLDGAYYATAKLKLLDAETPATSSIETHGTTVFDLGKKVRSRHHKEKYARDLQRIHDDHMKRSERFRSAHDVVPSEEQLKTLKALGYVE